MNLLGEKVKLFVVFEERKNAHRDAKWFDYNFTSFQGIFLEKGNEKKVLKELSKQYDLFIGSDYLNKFCQYTLKQFKKQHKPTVMQVDGGLAIPRNVLINKAISYRLNQYDYFLSSGKTVDEKYFQFYDIPSNRIYHYHFSCMPKKELELCASMAKQRVYYREKLNFQEETILLSVGQQIPRKGYDILARAMNQLDKNIGLYIIGGTPEEAVQQYVNAHQLTNIHFIPFKQKEELREYYAAADVFVLPTRYDIWGLVINEALAYGLPTISTDHCVAALEFQREGDCCEIVPVENEEALAKTIQQLTIDSKKQTTMKENALKAILPYNMEQMRDDIFKALENISSL